MFAIVLFVLVGVAFGQTTTPSPTAVWPLIGDGTANSTNCTCVDDQQPSEPCDRNETITSFGVIGSSTARYVFNNVDNNSTSISHFHLTIPDCVTNFSAITATDCAGEPLEVAINDFSILCNRTDFPGLGNATVIKVNVDSSTCNGSDVFVTITMPGAVVGVAGDDMICVAGLKAATECTECHIDGIAFGCDVTNEPTLEPTGSPTNEPSAEPSLAPTDEPSAEPSLAPTNEPSAEPSPAPTVPCSENCIIRDNYVLVDDGQCGLRGNGSCLVSVCVGTSFSCESDLDCECGCLQEQNGTKKRTVEQRAFACDGTSEPSPVPTNQPSLAPTGEPSAEPTTEPGACCCTGCENGTPPCNETLTSTNDCDTHCGPGGCQSLFSPGSTCAEACTTPAPTPFPSAEPSQEPSNEPTRGMFNYNYTCRAYAQHVSRK